MKTKNSEMLNNMDVKKLLIKLSIPATMGMMVNGLYNLMDTLFVAVSEGEYAIGALAFAFPVQMIVMAIGLMIGIGAASVFSRAYGSNDQELMKSTVNAALRFDVIAALLVSVLAFVFLKDLLLFFGASEGNYQFSYDYLSVILVGLVPLTLSMVLNNLTRAEGRANIAMKAMILGTGLNILLDPIFIFDWGLGMGIRGAAIATVSSQIIAFLYIFRQSFAKDSVLRISLKKFFFIELKTVRKIVVIGAPTFIRNSIGALIAILIYKIIEYYTGDTSELYISMYGVINRIIFFVFMPAFGLVQGLTPIAGFNYGAKNYKRLRDVIIYTTKLITIYFIFGLIFIQLYSPLIFDVFSKNDDVFFITYGSNAFRTMSWGILIVGFQIILGSIYQSFGYPRRAMLISLSRQLIFFVPIVFIMTYILGLDGLWYSFIIADILSGLLSLFMLRHELKVLKIKSQ
jgi:putative MATE family efflux protein